MTRYPLDERKLVYRVLHQNLVKHPELMDSVLLAELQADLQQIAQQEGVDISDHGQWDAWLGNETVSCQVRVANRKVITG